MICNPIRRNAARWRSIGRGPSSQPPGKDNLAFPNRETIAPKKTIEERISRIKVSGISPPCREEESISRVSSSRFTRQPSVFKIRTAVSTSDSRGQLCKTTSVLQRSEAARRGRVLFFAPCTRSSPFSLQGPSILKRSKPQHPFTRYFDRFPFYAWKNRSVKGHGIRSGFSVPVQPHA